MASGSLTFMPKLERLSPLVFRVLGCNPGTMTLQGTNTYLVGFGREKVLIDAGEPGVSEYVELLQQVIHDQKLWISHILCTHWHGDHTGGVADVLRSLRQNLVTELPKIWKFPAPTKDFKLNDRLNAFNSESETGSGCGDGSSVKTVSLNYLKDDQKFIVEGATLQIRHTPGHTTDHVALWLEEEKSLFSGDCILGEGTTVFEDLHTYLKSLEMIIEMEPVRIYPGHGPVIDGDPVERVRHYVRHRASREAQILTSLKTLMTSSTTWVTPDDVVKIVYQDVNQDLWPVAAINVKHHLEKLVKDGVVDKREGDFYDEYALIDGGESKL